LLGAVIADPSPRGSQGLTVAHVTDGTAPRRDEGLAVAYRKAEPYMAACYSLVGSVAGLTFLGYWLDRRMGHSTQWLLVVCAVLGLVVGFVAFFSKIARADRSAAPRMRAAADSAPAAPRQPFA
jgi:F0F1-type ATP synthase assembly protein I